MGPNDAAEPDGRSAPWGGGEFAPQQRLQETFELAHDAQLMTDGHGLILQANFAAAALLRCPKEFLTGKPLGLFVSEGHRHRFYECVARLWQGIAADQFDSQFARKGERPRVVDVRARVADGQGDARAAQLFWWVLRDVTELRRSEAERRELLRRLVSAQEDERRRVSRELHDSVGQLLTALTIAVRVARDAAPLPPAADARLAEVQRIADELYRAAHDLAVRLRPTVLDDVGLAAALAQYVAEWAGRSGVEMDYEASAVETDRLPRDVETAVYRVVQEALTNVTRHSRATRVSVVVARHAGYATVAVEDDGAGFDPAAVALGRLGLIGMRERVAQTGGTLDVESNPGQGTTILARFPLRNDGGGAR